MNSMKKIFAVVMAIAMVMIVAIPAFAASNLTGGEAGTVTTPDTTIVQDRAINVQKELLVYNANSTTVYAPAFAYQYTVTPASVAGLTITDETTDHNSGTAVNVNILAGLTTGLTINGGTAGTAASATGTVALTNATALTASASGASNIFDIQISFENVAFTQPGVYRYEITESLAGGKTYADIAVEQGTAVSPLYLDVYVDGNDSDGDGKLDIYGYVCLTANTSVTPATEKTNGFVDDGTGGTGGGGTGNTADKYYTYDLTISKDVQNDAYAEANTAFPFTVIFSNPENYNTTFAIGETVGTGSTGITPAAGAPTWSGVALVKDGGAITYTGIPAGVDVDVYETNVADGVTYTVTTAINGSTASTDNNVVWDTAPAAAVAQTARANYQSTKATIDTTKNTNVAAAQTITINNTLLLISPTGYIDRYAPYLLILGVGCFMLVFFGAKRRKKETA